MYMNAQRLYACIMHLDMCIQIIHNMCLYMYRQVDRERGGFQRKPKLVAGKGWRFESLSSSRTQRRSNGLYTMTMMCVLHISGFVLHTMLCFDIMCCLISAVHLLVCTKCDRLRV